MNAIDINQNFDLLALTEKDTDLKRVGKYYMGPCPMPGCDADKDGFVLKNTLYGWRWYCRKCGDGKYHTSLDYIIRRDGVKLKDAIARLGENCELQKRWPAPARPKTIDISFPLQEWQDETWKTQTAEIVDLLRSPEAEIGRQYLFGRGLVLSTWEIASLGFGFIYDPKAKISRPAITIPHYDYSEMFSGVKIRFLDQNPGGLRYYARKGSQFYLYGLWNLLPSREILLIVEGEINALSIIQCRPAGVNILSIGSESISRAQAAMLKLLAARHRRVVIWTDEPDKSEKVKLAIDRPDAERLKSNKPIDGEKQDANELLRSSLLSSFLSAVLDVECLGILPTQAFLQPARPIK